MDDIPNTIHLGDCIAGMNALPAGRVDLVFADPPFNIGYDYDVYDDRKAYEHYLAWSRAWIAAVHRVLKSDGTFWLAIGDEFAAELKLESQKIGFHCRSWVIWYYTFGVNCTKKFTRSHAHLFYFVKDLQTFTFLDGEAENRIPSARQLVYNDKRANPRGRLPDDTWIIRPSGTAGEMVADDEWLAPRDDDQTWTLRPQDLAECFTAEEDTWYFPRVAGTFKERAGFHGCQMPEQLLGRIIRACSNEGDLVLDPFSGSATTVAVAKKLARRHLAFDVSADYVQRGNDRLSSIRAGDPLDGSAEPLMSAPKSGSDRNGIREVATANRGSTSHSADDIETLDPLLEKSQLAVTCRGIVDAFRLVRHGFSADRVVADPDLNHEYLEICRKLGLPGDARTWNRLLFRLRKRGQLSQFVTSDRTAVSWQDCDPYLFASEIAWKTMIDDHAAETLDEILCDPGLAEEFDKRARKWAPGFTPLQYRWAGLKLRKQANLAKNRGSVLVAPSRLSRQVPLEDFDIGSRAGRPAVYLVRGPRSHGPLYVGEALDLRCRLGQRQKKAWDTVASGLTIQTFEIDPKSGPLAWESCLAKKFKPRYNVHDLYVP